MKRRESPAPVVGLREPYCRAACRVASWPRMSLFVTPRWTDVDPATHTYDRVAAHAAIRECFGHGLLPPAAARREDLEARITRVLVADVGSWAGGWNWSSSEPGGGGP